MYNSLNVFLTVGHYLNRKELSEIVESGKGLLLPDRDILLLKEEYKDDVLEQYPTLNECIEDYGTKNLTDVFDSEFEGGYSTIEVDEIQLNTYGILSHLIADTDNIEEFLIKSDSPEEELNDYIDATISHFFTCHIADLITKFESMKKGYFFEPDFLELKEYKVTTSRKWCWE